MENMNWSDLAFGYMKTDYNVRCYYRDGKWGELEVSSSEIINIHMAATCLHYGQESFEGLKAFKGKDGKIRVFRMDENGKRMQASSRGIKMAELPVEMFEEAVRKVVKLNERFVPPYESGAALYIRPLMIGLGAQVGVKPAPEYMFMIFVTPVGPYFKGGLKPSKVCIMREYDRAAPQGTGTIKVGGNYAASLVAGEKAKEKGYASTMLGRRRPVPELKSSNFMQRSFGERVAMNSPIQGSAADIIKIAMNRVYERMKQEGLKSRLVLQVHDELLIETKKEEIETVSKILEEEMKGAAHLSVELEIDMHEGENWYEAK